jgi:hypothetical protein
MDASVVLPLVAGLLSRAADPTSLATLARTPSDNFPVVAQQPSLRYIPTPAAQQAAVREYARQQAGSTLAQDEQFVATFGPGAPADYTCCDAVSLLPFYIG